MVKLQSDDGTWVEGHEGLCNLIGTYFTNLFTPREEDGVNTEFLDPVSCMITDIQNEELGKEFTLEEFKLAISQMHPDKAPGPDGFNPAFFQKCLETVGNDIFVESVKWLNVTTPQF